MPSVYIKTYGCQMNERDSEAVAAQLVAKGYTLADSEATADVVLLNTCSVRDFAERKAINKMVNVAAEMRRSRPEVVLGFLGCMAQSRGQELIDRLPDVDLVLGTQKFHRAADYLDELLAGRRDKIVDVAAEAGSEAAIREHLLNGSARQAVTAFVSIMQGCNQRCTFCIVPFTRGEERSRSIADIVAECRELAARGVKEVTLLGQIVTSYGRRGGSQIGGAELPLGQSEDAQQRLPTTKGVSPFVQLLEAVHEVAGLERIRFTSPHPKGYGDDLVAAYGRLPKLCESAHLPVQSGSDRMLKLMHRGYTRERFLDIIGKLRQVRPAMGISTDLIVGFPGETEEDFEQTLSLARAAEFDMAYIFKYSPRRDTPAAEMPDQLPAAVKEERNQRLLDLVNEIANRRYRQLVG
jgi:tRNA-2-methylthio-N6-dimethylallyladenosine synthase